MAKLTKPARIGATVFGVGVDERLVIERAQREYEYREAERAGTGPVFLRELMQDASRG